MRNQLTAAAVLLTAGLVGAAHAGAVTSTFDTDTEGWGFLNDAQDLAWLSDEGNPAGSLTARDRGTGAIWYYSASDAYLGDQSSFIGGELSWEIRGITGNQTSIPDPADVMLSGGGITIGIDSGVQPINGQWVPSSVTISESSDWKIVSSLSGGTLSGTDATAADIQTVLANLSGLYIRGEYTNGSDRTALDNVELVPTPGSAALLAGAGLVALRRKR